MKKLAISGKLKKNKLRIYNRCKNDYTKKELNIINNKIKLEIKKAKFVKFNEFITDINPNTNVKEIYKKINLFNDKKIHKINNHLNFEELKQFLTDKSVSTGVGTQYTKCNKTNHTPFEINEIRDIIQKNKNTAPGINNISNKLLKILPLEHIEKINTLFNNIETYPKGWNEVFVKPILKPNKDPNLITSYRPISLINVLAKTFNKLLKNRIAKLC